MEGPTFRLGSMVAPRRNGFDPSTVLRDFDRGKASTLADGRTLREWEIASTDKELEIAPGVHYPAWTFNGWTTLRGPAGLGERLREVNFDHLIARANQQRAMLEPWRVQAGAQAFGTAPAE
ncbi:MULTISPECIES: hypothetical protein [Nocardia]|uniref:hypothetical protein n=1 Tax=Nocardia TaxID=1817 RepID=UPI0007A42081|nr:hypothetical protein [Nocardia pseudovaccinii]